MNYFDEYYLGAFKKFATLVAELEEKSMVGFAFLTLSLA